MKKIRCLKSIRIADNPSYIVHELKQGEVYEVSDYLAKVAYERGYAGLVEDNKYSKNAHSTQEKMFSEEVSNKMINTSLEKNKQSKRKISRARKQQTED